MRKMDIKFRDVFSIFYRMKCWVVDEAIRVSTNNIHFHDKISFFFFVYFSYRKNIIETQNVLESAMVNKPTEVLLNSTDPYQTQSSVASDRACTVF